MFAAPAVFGGGYKDGKGQDKRGGKIVGVG
jgi:hypothetical protein